MDDVTGLTPRLAKMAGTWRRLFAFCLDGLFLGAFGAWLGLLAYDRLAALGDWGRVVGFAISLVYFGAMGSELSGGQTLGIASAWQSRNFAFSPEQRRKRFSRLPG